MKKRFVVMRCVWGGYFFVLALFLLACAWQALPAWQSVKRRPLTQGS